MPVVSVTRVKDKGDTRDCVFDAVRSAMELAGWEEVIKSGLDIAVKPNLCLDILLPGHITSAWVMEGVIRVIRNRVGRIYVVESDTFTTDCENGVRVSGIYGVCKQYDVEWYNFSKNKFVAVTGKNIKVLGDKVDIPELLTKVKLISVPVMKTHGNSIVSGAIKNQWGCLRKSRLDYHEHIDEALADLNTIIKPVFSIMDATIGCDGKGPKQGTPRILDCILASADNVALDAVATKIMGIPIEKVVHIKRCEERQTGIGALDKITILGESTDKLNFKFRYGKKSLITSCDLALRRPFLKGFFYRTPIFNLIVFIARLNYPIWMFLIGNRRRDSILYSSRYGLQWVKNL